MQSPIKILLLFIFCIICACGLGMKETPCDPEGIPVWADDGSEIACAVNKSVWYSSITSNHEGDFKYDINLCDSSGQSYKKIITARKIDGYESKVLNLYYMKTSEYLIIKSQMYGSGGKIIEKYDLNGTNLVLCLWDREGNILSDTLNVEIIPSFSGNILLKSFCIKQSSNTNYGYESYRYIVKFLDAEHLAQIGSTQIFDFKENPIIRWVSDSTVIYIDKRSLDSGLFVTKLVSPFKTLSDAKKPRYYYPATSSSIYYPDKGFLSWDEKSKEIEFNKNIPEFLDYWGF